MILLLWLTGCWVTGAELASRIDEADADTDTDTDTDTDADVTPFDVLEVSPAHGTDAGGDVVEITLGEKVEGVTKVTFGTAEARLLDAGSRVLTVEVPASGRVGLVDIKVEAGSRAGVAKNGFRYWPDAEGRTSALGEIGWWAYQGGYWGEDLDYGVGWFGFTEPTDADWGDLYGGALDSCTRTPSSPDLTWRDPGVASLVLDGTPFTNDRGVYESEAFGLTSMTDGGDLTMASATAWPELDVAGFMAPITEISITSPDVGGDLPDVVGSSFQVTWGGTAADAVVLRLYRYEGESVVDEVECRLRDDGKFLVPSSAWSRWTTGDQVTIVLGRATFPEATVPFDHGRVRLATTWWSVGAVFTF